MFKQNNLHCSLRIYLWPVINVFLFLLSTFPLPNLVPFLLCAIFYLVRSCKCYSFFTLWCIIDEYIWLQSHKPAKRTLSEDFYEK